MVTGFLEQVRCPRGQGRSHNIHDTASLSHTIISIIVHLIQGDEHRQPLLSALCDRNVNNTLEEEYVRKEILLWPPWTKTICHNSVD